MEFGFSPLGMTKEEVVQATGANYPLAEQGQMYTGSPLLIGGGGAVSTVVKAGAGAAAASGWTAARILALVGGALGLADIAMPDWGLFQQNGGKGAGPSTPSMTTGPVSAGVGGPRGYIVKRWTKRVDSRDGDFNLEYCLVKEPNRPYRVYMLNTRTGVWKSWGMPRPAVIGKNMPSHRMLTRLRRNLKRQSADAKTILQITSPTAYAKQLGYKKYRRRR